MDANDRKAQTILEKNTYFLNMANFDANFEEYIKNISSLLIDMHNQIQEKMQHVQYKVFVEYVQKEHGLLCILALMGLSKETLERILKFTIDSKDIELSNLLHIDKWEKKTDKYNIV